MLVPLVLLMGFFALVIMCKILFWPPIKEQIEKDYKVSIELEELDLAFLLNGVTAKGLTIRDLSEREIVHLDSIEVSCGLLGALFGSTEDDIDLSGLLVTAWEDSNGILNFAELERAKPDSGTATETAPEEVDGAGGGFDIEVRMVVNLDQVQFAFMEFENADVQAQLVPAFEPIVLNSAIDATVLLHSDGAVEASVAKLDSETQFHTGSFSGELQLFPADAPQLAAFQNLVGRWTVQPQRIADAFKIELPVEFTPEARETVQFDLSGKITSTELPEMISDLAGELKLELEDLTAEGLTLDGQLVTSLEPNLIQLNGNFDASGGSIVMEGSLIPDHPEATIEDPSMRTSLVLTKVPLGHESAELLSFLHPAFAVFENPGTANIEGITDANIKLAYNEPIPWEQLASEEPELSPEALEVAGSLTINQIRIEGSRLMKEMMQELGGDADGTFTVRPISFELKGGRLYYREPWTWTIADSQTSFEGSIGLDQSLSLVWHVPVTAGLAKRHRALRALKGKQIDIPIQGTSTNPVIDFDSVLESVGGSLIEGFLPGMGGQGQGESPEELFDKANKLWDAGQFAEAAKLYSRIRSDYKLTMLYTLNRKRIKKRSKYTQ